MAGGGDIKRITISNSFSEIYVCLFEYSISIKITPKLEVQLVDVMQVKICFGCNPGHGDHIYASVPQYKIYGKSDL